MDDDPTDAADDILQVSFSWWYYDLGNRGDDSGGGLKGSFGSKPSARG